MATINGIEQGISCYSYTQEFIENEDWSIDTIFEHVAAKGVSKVELVGAQTFQQYPTPRPEEIDAVLAAGAKHGVEVFSYGGYVDLGRITGYQMSREDILSDIRLDIMTARSLGAKYLRATGFEPELAPAVNDLAERYGVQIGFEIHAPHTPADATTRGFMETIEKNRLESFGLVPDFGMFIERPTEIAINRYVGLGAKRETLDWIIANRHNGMTEEEMQEHVAKNMGGGEGEKVAISEWFGYLSFAPAELDSFAAMVPYVKYVHGKFYHLELDADGKVFEPTIPYEKALSILADGGFQGAFISEYEGHAFYLNDADEQLDRHLTLGKSILESL
ncbi:TIM barrel protein [Actinomyces succiniciruminis]|uniref:16S rRNA processing protein RimM n=1 Tax=Actinomyces succiniciruminis TaxID=1522002 RepID=A0A1L7RS62_9ACTO|nr:TIM barrel protein [Actinomyces succiniciruminis]CED92023.1 16S rRNA processing protein RimM [Actinomyces succiniciruminis]